MGTMGNKGNTWVQRNSRQERRYDAYCPNCGANNGEITQGSQVTCRECGWNFIN